ncbi:MAG: permease, partial [Lysobacteraceae bacterium]
MTAEAAPVSPDAATIAGTNVSPTRLLLFGLLGFSAGLPYYMFSTILSARLTTHGVDLVIIGFFGWVQLLPTFKFAWAPLLDRYAVPG